MNPTSSQIQVLPQEVANRIAAGEVVERPAAVVRELLDNSIDAGARRIDIEVEEGGIRLIKITDDGCGMSPEDAKICIQRHATSKIRSFEDLERLTTKGFRGEALAAISSVSKFSLQTRRRQDEFATLMETQNGSPSDPKTAGGAYGTTITLRELFYNTPARKKFLKKPATEQSHILNTVTGSALAHEHIHFTLKHNQKRVIDCPAVQNRPERIRQLFGQDILENLIPVNMDTPMVSLSGLISRPVLSRNNAQHMHFFVNNRLVKDRLMHSAAMNAYRNLIHAGRYPVLFLYYDIDPAEIDINVHPTKQEIKFSREDAIYSITYGAIRKTWDTREEARQDLQQRRETTESTSGPEPVSPRPPQPDMPKPADLPSPVPELPLHTPAAHPLSKITVHPRQDQTPPDSPFFIPQKPRSTSAVESIRQLNRVSLQTAESEPLPQHSHSKTSDPSPIQQNGKQDLQPLAVESRLFQTISLEETENLTVIGQWMDSYILAESDEGLLIIDQHAAHERVMFEKFWTQAENASLESQSILIPLTLDFSPKEAELIEQNQALFSQLGFELEPFGPRTFVFRAIPSSLDMGKVEETLQDILGDIQKEGSAQDIRDRALSTMACRASVKFGDPLSMDEMKALIRELEKMPRRNVCPHGRPNILILTDAAMRKAFKRTGF